MLKLIHSFQYLDLQINCKYKIVDNYIKDDKNTIVLGLHDIPSDTNLYKIGFSKLLIKKKSIKNPILNTKFNIKDDINICIYVDIYFDKLMQYIYNCIKIPDHELFFKLLKNNINRFNKLTHIDKLNIITTNHDNIMPIFFNDSIIKYNSIYIDIKNERFYINKKELMDNNKLLMGNIIITNPTGKVRKQIIDHNNKMCIITKSYNIEKWNKKNSIVINKKNFIDIDPQAIKNANIVIINQDLLYSKKYINEWKCNPTCSMEIYYKTLQIYYNRNNNMKSRLLLHLLNYNLLIIDDCLVSSDLLKLFNYKKIYYITSNYNLSISSLQSVLLTLFNIKINRLNYDYISNGIYFDTIKTNFKYKFTKANIKNSIGLNEVENINDIILYNSLELNINPIQIKIDKHPLKIFECSICYDNCSKNIGCFDSCLHKFCITCIDKLEQQTCPLCRTPFHKVYKLYPNTKHLSNRLNYLLSIKNGLIISKYEITINNLVSFYNNLNIRFNKVDGTFEKFNNNNILMSYNNYFLLNKDYKYKKVYILEELNDNDLYYKNILDLLNCKTITIINNLFK